jgi:hypothetical protein
MNNSTAGFLIKFSSLSALIVLLGVSAASAQTTTGTALNIGNTNTVTGLGSTAIGIYCQATSGSLAQGAGSTAPGSYSAALGNSSCIGQISISTGKSTTGSMGVYCLAANASTIYFPANITTAPLGAVMAATALNYGYTAAEGAFSANIGTANNYLSSAFGYRTVTASPSQFVIGICNRKVGANEDWTNSNHWNDSTWPASNALFIIGNGNPTTPSNAMQVRRDGLVLINSSGDLGMGSYTNGPTP